MKTHTVYLLHFERPISPKHTCQHYLGSTSNLAERIALHRAGHGSRLCQVAKERDIRFVVVETWEGGMDVERQLKKRKEGPRLCPVCRAAHSLEFTLSDVPELAF